MLVSKTLLIMKGGIRLKSIVEKLVENSVPEDKAAELVESAKRRLREGESPVDVLYAYQDTIKSKDILDILPDEK